jgi:hypothetical protein
VGVEDHEARLRTVAEYAEQESRGLLQRVHDENNLTFGELTDLAYMLQGLAAFARAADIEPQSFKAPPRLRVIK